MSSTFTTVRAVAAAGLAAALALGVSACGSASSAGSTAAGTGTPSTTAASTITITQAWVRTTEGAMDTTMAPLFITIANGTAKDVTIASGTSTVAARVEFHEMVMQNGKMVMQRKQTGIAIKAGGSTVLKPGGDHVMLMGLKQALAVGSEVTVQLTFSDGTTKTVTAPVKKFADGNAQYAGSGTATSSMPMSGSMSPSASGSMGTMTP